MIVSWRSLANTRHGGVTGVHALDEAFLDAVGM
jgi:hypothetical protein